MRDQKWSDFDGTQKLFKTTKGVSKEEVEKMKQDAASHTAEDKKRREEVDARNQADTLVFQTRKQMKEFGEKMADRLSGLIGEIKQLYRTETYRPSPQAECRYCDFKSLCPLWPEGRELFPRSVKVGT